MAIFNKKTQEKDDKKKTTSTKSTAKPKKEEKESMADLYQSTGAVQKEEKGQKKAAKKHGQAYRILMKPLITEKAANMGALNKYVFEVSADANKIEVAKAIEEVYGVKPTQVNIINVLGKVKRQGRNSGKRKDWRKAVVTLPEGKTIKVYEGV